MNKTEFIEKIKKIIENRARLQFDTAKVQDLMKKLMPNSNTEK
jgi:hypothetical protein